MEGDGAVKGSWFKSDNVFLRCRYLFFNSFREANSSSTNALNNGGASL